MIKDRIIELEDELKKMDLDPERVEIRLGISAFSELIRELDNLVVTGTGKPIMVGKIRISCSDAN
jgi:hypothetical protein